MTSFVVFMSEPLSTMMWLTAAAILLYVGLGTGDSTGTWVVLLALIPLLGAFRGGHLTRALLNRDRFGKPSVEYAPVEW